MSRFCSNCGAELNEEDKFCQNCGAKVEEEKAEAASAEELVKEPEEEKQAAPAACGKGEIREGIPTPGFSDRVNHPQILAAVKRNRKAAKVFLLILVPIPVIGFLIYSLATGNIEVGPALGYGCIVSAVFLVFALVSFIRERAKNTYEAVVTDKKEGWTYRNHGSSEDREQIREYVTIVRTTDGKKKKIVEHEGSQIWAYNYLEIGDRFKYHPQFHFPYELYDKSKAPYIACVSCGTRNPVEADRCSKCKLPLLK